MVNSECAYCSELYSSFSSCLSGKTYSHEEDVQDINEDKVDETIEPLS